MTSNPQMPGCAGTNLINLIYTKLSTFPSSKISQIIHPFPSLPQGIRRKASLSGLRTTGGIHPFSTPLCHSALIRLCSGQAFFA